MVMSGLGGHGLPIFGFDIVAPNYVDGQAVPINPDLAQLGKKIHYWLGWIMLATISLHLIGALKHYFVYKDGTLRRMLGRRVE